MGGKVNTVAAEPRVPDTQSREQNSSHLNGWKEIASYFGRSVRTVQRWEAMEAMPVRRHRHSLGESIYANCHELESWRITRSQIARGRIQPRTLQVGWTTPPLSRDDVIRALLTAIVTLDPAANKTALGLGTRDQANRQSPNGDAGILDERQTLPEVIGGLNSL